MKLIVMRHGQTAYNVEHRYTGTTDIPLTETGRAQAVAAGTAPGVKLAYVSPLVRARQTAQLCFPNAELRAVEGLREIDFGAYEGRIADATDGDPAFQAWFTSHWRRRPPGGQTRDEHQRIVLAAVNAILDEREAAGAPYALAVAHGGVIMAICDGMLCDEERAGHSYLSWNPGNCGLICADVYRDDAGNRHLRNLEVRHSVGFIDSL